MVTTSQGDAAQSRSDIIAHEDVFAKPEQSTDIALSPLLLMRRTLIHYYNINYGQRYFVVPQYKN